MGVLSLTFFITGIGGLITTCYRACRDRDNRTGDTNLQSYRYAITSYLPATRRQLYDPDNVSTVLIT